MQLFLDFTQFNLNFEPSFARIYKIVKGDMAF